MLKTEFELEDLGILLHKIKVKSMLSRLLLSIYSNDLEISKKDAVLNKHRVRIVIEELRNTVLQTSEVKGEDVAREIKEVTH